MKKMELLAPAGDLEKLKIAVLYGADAVYFGGNTFNLRAGADGMTIEEIEEGLKFAHDRGCRCYMTLNIFAHNEDIAPLKEYLSEVKALPIDAFIVSDPGVIFLIREYIPDAEIHLSTQANMTNYATAKFWHSLGVKRIVLARELSLDEIREIRANIPEDMELEAFVHGAMCISYSGRCLLSNFMAERDSNRGQCAHPCRWKYSLQEEKRPGEFFPVEEDARGTYIMNSNDLCMIDHIPELAEAGILSLKIEGRIKSIFYVATVIAAYRKALDAYYDANYSDDIIKYCEEEVSKVSHRRFTTGFYFNKPDNEDQNYSSSSYIRDYSFTGLVKSYDSNDSFAVVEQRNKMCIGDIIEVFGPNADFFTQTLNEMYDLETGEALEAAPHPQQMLKIKLEKPAGENFMIRMNKGEKNV